MGIKYIFKRLMAEWKANMWLAVELLIVSVVIWIIVDQLYVQTKRVSEDRGFDISNTFLVDISTLNSGAVEYKEESANDSAYSFDRMEMVERLRRRPEVECVGLSVNAYPYCGSNSGTGLRYINENGDTLLPSNGWILLRSVDPGFIKVFGYRGANGESPEHLAEILEKNPNSIMLSSNVFGDKTPDITGKEVEKYEGDYVPKKVSAIITPVKYTEYFSSRNSLSVVCPMGTDQFGNPGWYNEVTVRVKDGMAKDFIENLMADSESQFRVGNQYIANVMSFDRLAKGFTLENKQATRNKYIVMSFLLVNVFLGLLGTFWFRTRQRFSEIALMKVAGATARSVFATQVGEGLLLLLLVTPVAAVIDINMAVMELNAYGDTGYLEWPRMIACIATVFVIMAVMIVCGVALPARRAMHVDPAEALHDE